MGRLKGTKNKVKKTKAESLPSTGAFNLCLAVNGEKIYSAGDTLEEALLNLQAFNPKTKGTFIITRNEKESRPMMFNIRQLKRLFYPGMTGVVQRSVFAKRYAFFA